MRQNEAYLHAANIVERLVNSNLIIYKKDELLARGIIQIYLEDIIKGE